MNTIKAQIDKSDYEDYGDFLNFRIDGYWLDEKLNEQYPGKDYKGLVPTLLFCMDIEEEQLLVWNRILPGKGETTICPILMCPDDCDFSCTLIVAEIENWGDTIHWTRLGLDKIKSDDPEKVGTYVDWFYNIGTLEFSIGEYLKMVQEFRKQLEIDLEAKV